VPLETQSGKGSALPASRRFRSLVYLAGATLSIASVGIAIAAKAAVALIPMLLVAPALLTAHTRYAVWIVIVSAIVLTGFWQVSILSIGLAYTPGVILIWLAGGLGALEDGTASRVAFLLALLSLPVILSGLVRLFGG
jgi:hypothetical protein